MEKHHLEISCSCKHDMPANGSLVVRDRKRPSVWCQRRMISSDCIDTCRHPGCKCDGWYVPRQARFRISPHLLLRQYSVLSQVVLGYGSLRRERYMSVIKGDGILPKKMCMARSAVSNEDNTKVQPLRTGRRTT